MAKERLQAIVKLLELVPEFRDSYNLTAPIEAFAATVRDAFRTGDDELAARGLEFVEELAASNDLTMCGYVIASFLEVAVWDEPALEESLGPASRRLWVEDPHWSSFERGVLGPEVAHTRMLERFPQLEPEFGLDEVIRRFASFVVAENAAGAPYVVAKNGPAHRDVVRRAFGYAEWLYEQGLPGPAARLLEAFFHIGTAWPDEAREWLGPKSAATLRSKRWAPPNLVERDL
jgi:hypothetical protein